MFVWDRMSQSQAFSSHHQDLLLILYLSNLTKISTNTETAMLSQDSSGRFKGSLFNVHCEKAFSKILRFLSQFTKKILVFFPHTAMQWRLESSFIEIISSDIKGLKVTLVDICLWHPELKGSRSLYYKSILLSIASTPLKVAFTPKLEPNFGPWQFWTRSCNFCKLLTSLLFGKGTISSKL